MNSTFLSLEQEQNPFEQSFHHSNGPSKPTLPPLTSTSLSHLNMSPTTHVTTLNPAYTSMSNDISTSIDPLNIVSNPAHPGAKQTAKKRKLQAKKYMNDEAKRKNFLERNRQAALKCRQRKKQWLNDLQSKVDYLTNDNEQLQLQCSLMRDELIQLRRMLWTHKEVHSIFKQDVKLLPPVPHLLSSHRGTDHFLQPMIVPDSSIHSSPSSFASSSAFSSSSSSPTHSLEQVLSCTSVLSQQMGLHSDFSV